MITVDADCREIADPPELRRSRYLLSVERENGVDAILRRYGSDDVCCVPQRRGGVAAAEDQWLDAGAFEFG